ncbi:MAG: DegT/DnrJ/EryC1/StrS family aminotransferase [Bacteroidota bacterium]
MNVPFVDLKAQYLNIKSEVGVAVQSVFEKGVFVGGIFVSEFEKSFGETYGVNHCIGVGNGTDALFLILKALGISEGDEVITPAHSWISTTETISLAGGTSVFADVDNLYYTIAPENVQSKINRKTKAVIVVHLYGQAAPVKEIAELCKKHDLFLIEDCSQAHLTEDCNQLVGKFGIASAFSFYPTKNLGAYGDAGCVLTSDSDFALKIRRLANHGGLNKDEHLMEGINSRLDVLQAAFLKVKLKHLGKWTDQRIRNASVYYSSLKDVEGIILPYVRPDTKHSFHLFVIRAKERNEMKLFLETHGIQTMIHYPTALPFEPAYKHHKYSVEDFAVAFKLSQEILSLPIYPELSLEQIAFVCEKIKEFYSK